VQIWIETLYARLRAAEQRAADPGSPHWQRRAGVATASWIAAQIERYEKELHHATRRV